MHNAGRCRQRDTQGTSGGVFGVLKESEIRTKKNANHREKNGALYKGGGHRRGELEESKAIKVSTGGWSEREV